jgi:hypothetical protein
MRRRAAGGTNNLQHFLQCEFELRDEVVARDSPGLVGRRLTGDVQHAPPGRRHGPM